jgi:cholesterol transport system auxiliary component
VSSCLALALLGGCAGLLPKAPPAPMIYGLDVSPVPALAAAGSATAPPARDGLTLVVSPPRAAAGFDTARMLYVRVPHRLEAFAFSEWVDAPAKMIAQPLVSELQRGTRWRAVVSAPSAAAGDWRLDIELLRLQQDFTVVPSQMRLSLRATLFDTTTRRVVAWQEFDESVPAPSEDAYGGVLAAQAALRSVLASLRRFCEDAADRRVVPAAPP